MWCVPTVSEEVVKLATPADVLPVPTAVPSSANVTSSPFGIVPKIDVTVAVKVTGCPTMEGDPDVVTTVFVPPLISSVSMGDVLPALFPSPEYTAVIEWVPTME